MRTVEMSREVTTRRFVSRYLVELERLWKPAKKTKMH